MHIVCRQQPRVYSDLLKTLKNAPLLCDAVSCWDACLRGYAETPQCPLGHITLIRPDVPPPPQCSISSRVYPCLGGGSALECVLRAISRPGLSCSAQRHKHALSLSPLLLSLLLSLPAIAPDLWTSLWSSRPPSLQSVSFRPPSPAHCLPTSSLSGLLGQHGRAHHPPRLPNERGL